eukprot:CAMPEP_0206052394 /NCGR_PEP_ID=MMETSP1466-20131121/33665_1 /ASSEMBLY_ACC=CAM_ASM_001126 /TAXON_ID=44452 /ORGANISM="Pavlova gyrans, Strain CCMP608" /LENGTH=97 /DNA_ID=CAMNT_0053427547 /DNA_START=37 /DNA_END=328 /DNA_ORIENTATION=-
MSGSRTALRATSKSKGLHGTASKTGGKGRRVSSSAAAPGASAVLLKEPGSSSRKGDARAAALDRERRREWRGPPRPTPRDAGRVAVGGERRRAGGTA